MVGWHHQFNEHEFEQTPGDSEGQETWNEVPKNQTQLGDSTTAAAVTLDLTYPG